MTVPLKNAVTMNAAIKTVAQAIPTFRTRKSPEGAGKGNADAADFLFTPWP
ncbi:MAG: hypothetical protein RJP95_03950 [Pirellulales bacterium]